LNMLNHGTPTYQLKENIEERLRIPFSEVIVDQEIGRGSFGTVYKGRWEGVQVAIKVCSTVEQKQLNEFITEAKLMLNLRPHPFVLQILGISVDGPYPAMILEFCDGGSLDKLVYSNAPISYNQVYNIMKGIALGMHHLHKSRIIHRDLATRNILLSKTMDPKIGDFGLSRFLHVSDVQQTQNNAIPIRWMAPESLSNQTYSVASDVWSWGILCSEILNSEQPLNDLDLFTAGTKIAQSGLTPKLPTQCPPWIVELLNWCWKYKPEQRPTFAQISETIMTNDPQLSK